MKVSNVGRLNFRPVKMLDRPEGGFSDLVKLELEEKICSGGLTKEIKTRDGETIRLSYGKGSEEYDPEHMIIIKCTAWGRTFQTNEELSRFYPHCSLPMDVELVHVDLSDMTDKKRAELNKKYQISSIKAYSKEYFALFRDLQEAGVLSNGNAYQLPPNVSNLFIDENGKVTGFATTYPPYVNNWNNLNFLDYTENALSFVADDFEEMRKWNWLTDEEQMAISVYDMHQNIVAAIEDIFSEQLNLKK